MRVNTYWAPPRPREDITDAITDVLGRVLRASEDVEKGDTLVIEYPVMVSVLTGPSLPGEVIPWPPFSA